LIRPYRPEDRDTIRKICVDTVWLGQPASERILDPWIWAEFWTRYFTDEEPEHTWVIEPQDQRITGYITGAADVRAIQKYTTTIMPGLAKAAFKRRLLNKSASRKAIWSTMVALAKGQLRLPKAVQKNFPATFHFNLLPEARGLGLGGKLFDLFSKEMRRMGIVGVHAQSHSLNQAATKFFERTGFRLNASTRLDVFKHIDSRPLYTNTWVLGLTNTDES